MNLSNTIALTQKPALYESGTAIMWTDPHISKQLLSVHLNTELDLASRSSSTITETVEWILGQVPSEKMDILDLGCGPGLYCEQFSQRGHSVTGVDFSANSISYAQEQAQLKNQDITYVEGNYCEMDLGENKYDLIIQIFTDMGVLSPSDRDTLLKSIMKSLKPGGILIFDIMHERAFDSQAASKEWELETKGFWRDSPYAHLGETKLYEDEKVILSQHIVIEEGGECETYRFWTHYFNEEQLADMVLAVGFNGVETVRNIIPNTPFYNGEDVLFCKAVKPE